MAESIIFMSYAHSDSSIDEQWLSRFAKHLAQDISDQTGEQHIRIEQQHLHTIWGDRWAEALGAESEQQLILIPVITPGFFDNETCKEECEGFLQREKILERDDLIVPMYYASYRPMNNPISLDIRRRRLVEELNAHTPVECRDISSKPMMSSDVAVQIQEMARRIAASLAWTSSSAATQAAAAVPAAQTDQSARAASVPQHKKFDPDWIAVMLVAGFILIFMLFVAQIYADEMLGAEIPPAPTSSVPQPFDEPTETPLILPESYNKVAFTSSRTGNQDIFVIDSDGTDLVQFTISTADDHSAAWSPDGQHIAFTSDRDENHEIYVMNFDGSNPRNLSKHLAGDIEPAWSPDGTRLAFVSDRDGPQNIYLMNADGTGVTSLTANQEDRNPAWSPDGRRIVFTSVFTDNPEIYIIDVDSKVQRRVTNELRKDAEPVWIDNSRIAFVSWRDNDGELYTMNADGSNLNQLTFESNNNDWDAEISPDGQQLMFTSTRDTPDGNKDIFVMPITASDPDAVRRLTDSPSDDYSPDWCCTRRAMR